MVENTRSLMSFFSSFSRKRDTPLKKSIFNRLPISHKKVISNTIDYASARARDLNDIDYLGISTEKLALFLGKYPYSFSKRQKSILVYRQSKQIIESMPIDEFEAKMEMKYTDSLIFNSPKTS